MSNDRLLLVGRQDLHLSNLGVVDGRQHGARNAHVDATSSLGWDVVRVNPDYFLGHGYCSSDSWFVRFISAVWQENKAGAFHPTKVGAAVTAKLVANASCPVLAGEDECKDMPLPDNPRASSNP